MGLDCVKKRVMSFLAGKRFVLAGNFKDVETVINDNENDNEYGRIYRKALP